MTANSTRRRERTFRVAMTIALVGMAAWFFGNAYEEVVIVPNLAFGDVQAGLVAFRVFFRATNPAIYYAIVGPVMVVSTAVAVLASERGSAQRRFVLRAVACVVPAALLTAYIVVHVNLRVFFGPVPDAELARGLARQWLALNAMRVALSGGAFVLGLRARTSA